MSGYIGITPDIILNKYTEKDLPLVYEYIGPYRTHGNQYLDPQNYSWFEFVQPVDYLPPNSQIQKNTPSRVGGCPLGIIQLDHRLNKYLFEAVHLSCIETLRKGQGDGTIMMMELEDFAKSMGYRSITLQSRADGFYKKLGFVPREILGTKIWRKYVKKI